MEREKEISELEQAIAAIDAQRVLLGEAVVQAALKPLKEKLATLVSAGSPDQQLKYVSILFADIVGSTQMSQKLDPEDILTIMGGALNRFKSVIEKHGGEVTRFMGDGLKAIFGMPTAREDDTERAVQAGLELLEESSRYAQLVESQWGLSGFTIRVGINSGYAVLGGGVEAGHTAMGMAINLAARMESAAPAGTLLISHETYRHVQGLIEVEAKPLIQVKGSDEPLRTYLVHSFRERVFKDVRRGVAGLAVPMLGRNAELAQLISACEQVASGGGAGLVNVVGDPGVGKSRLLMEFEQWFNNRTQSMSCFKGRAVEQLTGTPYAFLRDLLLDIFEIHRDEAASTAGQMLLEQLTPYFADQVEMKAHFIGALMGIDFPDSLHLRGVRNDPDQLRQRALFYLAEYLIALQNDGLVVIFLDDIQWADAPSLEAILQVAKECRSDRLLVVCAARPEFILNRSTWEDEIEASRLAFLQIRLRSLSNQDSLEMVDELLQRVDNPPDTLRKLIVSKAEGNPYYIEELIKMLVEDSVIQVSGVSAWEVDLAALSELHIPPTLTAVLQARLDSLPAAEKDLLQQASVIGRVFWDKALMALIDEQLPVRYGLNRLVEREMTLPSPGSAFTGGAEYQFKHDILRDVTYDSILKSLRAYAHARAAEWLADVAEANQVADRYAEAIANHYQKAGDLLLAVDWFNRAGEYALRRGAPDQALSFFQTSDQLVPVDQFERRFRCLQGQVQSLSLLGGARAGIDLSEAMVALAIQMQDDYRLADALCSQVHFLGVLGDHHKELKLIDQALATARKSNNLEVENRLLGMKVVSLSNSGDLQAAQAAVDEVLDFVKSVDDEEMLAITLINVSVFYSTIGDLAQAAHLTSQQVEVTQRLGDLRNEAYNLENLGYLYIMLGMPARGIEALNRVQELAELTGDRRIEFYNQLNQALAYIRSGDHSRARSILESIIESSSEEDELFARASSQAYYGMLLEETHSAKAALESYLHAADLFQQAEARGYLCDVWAGMARSYLDLGDTQASLKFTRQVWEYLTDNGPSGLEFPTRAYLTCVDIFELCGENQLALEALQTGCQDLEERAGKISDDQWRESYLRNIPEHKKILERSDKQS
ncbi:MAG: ATP-binding protein [Anaerolineales bacterium]